MKKVHIELESTGYNFYWAEKGYRYRDGTLITCCWEDITYTVIVDGKNMGKRHTTVDARPYIQSEIDQLEGEFGAKMEIDYPGYIEEELSSSCFGLPMKDIIKSKEILIGYCYNAPDDPERYETDLYNVPLNEFGMKPSYIVGYTPHDNVGREEVQDFMKLFVGKHYNIEEFIEFSFEWINTPYDIEEQWDNHLKEIEEWEKMKKEGKKFSVRYAIPFMKQIFGEEVVDKYIERGMIYGEPIDGAMDQVLLTFEDGHTEILKNDDFESDHFGEPELP